MNLSSIINTVTQATYFAIMMAALAAAGVPTASWTSPRNTDLSLTQELALLLAVLRQNLTLTIRGLFLDYAGSQPGDSAADAQVADNALTAFALSQYQLTRTPAQYTVGQMVLTSVAGAPAYSFGPGDITVGTPGPATANSRFYTDTTGGTLNSGGTLTLSFQATVAGIAGNIPAGSPLQLKTSYAGVSVTNPAIGMTGTWVTTQGADLESNARLKLRCPSRFGTTGVGGNADAFTFWALAIPNGYTSSPVAQVEVFSNYYNGAVTASACTVVIIGPSGALGGGDVAAVQANFESPIASLANANIPGLDTLGKKYPINGKVQVVSAANLSVPLTGTVSIYRSAGVAVADVETAVTAALTTYQGTLGIGEELYPQQKIAGVIGQAAPFANAIARVDLSGMASSITPTLLQYPILDASGLTYQLVDQ